jgi:hypothetical protein
MMKFLLVLFITLSFAHSFSGPGVWIVTKEQDGIKMYGRHSEYSKFDDIKVETDFTGNAAQLISILEDIPKYTEWAYATKSSVLIKKINSNEFIYYSEIAVPWPAADRDFYAYCKIIPDHNSRSFKFIAESIKDYAPEKKNIVRIPLSKGSWNITTVSDKLIHVEYTLELDPGGTVPAWLLNLFSTKGPMETFANLKQKMKSLNK